MSDEEFQKLVDSIDSDVLPTRTKPTKKESEKSRRDYAEWLKDWTEYNAT